MICKFCGSDEKLIDCHIIPKSLYKPLFEGGEIPEMHTNTEGEYKKKSPSGVYDKGIVCAECEKRFSNYDSYAADFFLHEKREERVLGVHDGLEVVAIDDFDYQLLKLFGISLLWRASASTHQFFKRVDIGPHEKRIKEMIWDQNPGNPDDYSMIIARFNLRYASSAIMDPHPTKYNGINYYRFYFNSYCVEIKVDQRPVKGVFRSFMITPYSPIKILTRDFAKSKEFKIAKSLLADG